MNAHMHRENIYALQNHIQIKFYSFTSISARFRCTFGMTSKCRSIDVDSIGVLIRRREAPLPLIECRCTAGKQSHAGCPFSPITITTALDFSNNGAQLSVLPMDSAELRELLPRM